jgi:hypothetical protein
MAGGTGGKLQGCRLYRFCLYIYIAGRVSSYVEFAYGRLPTGISPTAIWPIGTMPKRGYAYRDFPDRGSPYRSPPHIGGFCLWGWCAYRYFSQTYFNIFVHNSISQTRTYRGGANRGSIQRAAQILTLTLNVSASEVAHWASVFTAWRREEGIAHVESGTSATIPRTQPRLCFLPSAEELLANASELALPASVRHTKDCTSSFPDSSAQCTEVFQDAAVRLPQVGDTGGYAEAGMGRPVAESSPGQGDGEGCKYLWTCQCLHMPPHFTVCSPA